MKKKFSLYIIAWLVLLALFNVIAFVSVGWADQKKYTPSFWTGYVFITIMFIGQFICSYAAFKADCGKKSYYKFYNISLIRISYIGLIVSFIVGGLCMLISPLPYWAGVTVCAIILAVNVLSVIKAIAAMNDIEAKIKTQTFFIKSLTVDADTLMASAKSDVAKAECRKVYEAIRYSDPMSNDALLAVEGQIIVKFAEFSDAVKADDAQKVAEIANECIILVGDRNKKCKLLK